MNFWFVGKISLANYCWIRIVNPQIDKLTTVFSHVKNLSVSNLLLAIDWQHDVTELSWDSKKSSVKRERISQNIKSAKAIYRPGGYLHIGFNPSNLSQAVMRLMKTAKRLVVCQTKREELNEVITSDNVGQYKEWLSKYGIECLEFILKYRHSTAVVIDIIKEAVKCGFNINHMIEFVYGFNTLLMDYINNHEIVSFLLENGANPNLMNEDQVSPLEELLTVDLELTLDEVHKMINMLKQHGAQNGN